MISWRNSCPTDRSMFPDDNVQSYANATLTKVVSPPYQQRADAGIATGIIVFRVSVVISTKNSTNHSHRDGENQRRAEWLRYRSTCAFACETLIGRNRRGVDNRSRISRDRIGVMRYRGGRFFELPVLGNSRLLCTDAYLAIWSKCLCIISSSNFGCVSSWLLVLLCFWLKNLIILLLLLHRFCRW